MHLQIVNKLKTKDTTYDNDHFRKPVQQTNLILNVSSEQKASFLFSGRARIGLAQKNECQKTGNKLFARWKRLVRRLFEGSIELTSQCIPLISHSYYFVGHLFFCRFGLKPARPEPQGFCF